MDLSGANAISYAPAANCEDEVKPIKAVHGSGFARMELPWEKRSHAGFKVPVEVRSSRIPGAGLGRFVTVPVKAGTVLRSDTLINFREYLQGPKGERAAIHLQSAEEIEALAEYFSIGNVSTEVREKMVGFIGSIGADRAQGTPVSFVLTHSFHVNHGDNPNFYDFVENGVLYYKTMRDLAAGEELIVNYRAMGMPAHVKEWCSRRGLRDVQTEAEEWNS
ncbi:unnamed protein product [Symbiodinium sp. CCMP2592]|nr:unnamed protein product [Symbiodinium sp. CCMP2592]